MALSNALKSAALQGASTEDLLGIISKEMGLPSQDVSTNAEARNLISSGYQGLIKLNGNVINTRNQAIIKNPQIVAMLDEAGQTQAHQYNQPYQNFGDGQMYFPSQHAQNAYDRDAEDMKNGKQAAHAAEKADTFSTSGTSNMRGNYSAEPTQATQQTTQQSTQSGQTQQKTNASEIARAQNVWKSAAQLVGTPGYEGKTVQQIQEAAHNYANDIKAGKVNFDIGSNPAGGNVSNSNQNTPVTNQTNQNVTAPSQTSQAATTQSGAVQSTLQAALDFLKNSELDPASKDIFSSILQDPNLGDKVDYESIIKSLTNYKNNTLDPYYQEVTSNLLNQTKNGYQNLNQARNLELESENFNSSQNIQNAQNDLESRGLTFSGEGVKQLGAKSAYAQPGTPEAQQSAIPLQTPFGGQFAEGTVNKSNRLMSSSSQARYQQGLNQMSQNLEAQLGSSQAAGVVPGGQVLGGVTDRTAVLPGQKQLDLKQGYSGIVGAHTTQQQQGQNFDVYNS